MNYDIQLFADSVQTTGAAGLSAEMKTFYDMTLLDEAGANLIHDQFGQKRPYSPHARGSTESLRQSQQIFPTAAAQRTRASCAAAEP